MTPEERYDELYKKIVADKEITLEVLSRIFGTHEDLFHLVCTHILDVTEYQRGDEDLVHECLNDIENTYNNIVTEKIEKELL